MNRKVKQLKAGCDSFDVLDVQGVDHKNISHYFAMIAFILSKVMVVCSADARLDLTIFPVLNTIATAMTLLQEKGVAFSIPVIYLPCKVGGWKVDEDTMIGESEIPHAVKELFPVLGEADIRVYVQFPDVGREQNPLLNEGFMNAVRCQMEEWKMIRSMTPIVERVEYAKIIIRAINANSPQMVYEANREFFGKKLKDLYASLHAQMQEQMRNDHRGREVTSSLMKYEDFLLYKEKSFVEEFERVSKQWAYYQAGFDSMLREYNCVIKVGDLVKDIFNASLADFGAHQKRILGQLNEVLRLFAEESLTQEIHKLPFQSPLDLPRHVFPLIEHKTEELKNQCDPSVSANIRYDPSLKWSVLAKDKKAEWDNICHHFQVCYDRLKHENLQLIQNEHDAVKITSSTMTYEQFRRYPTKNFSTAFQESCKRIPGYHLSMVGKISSFNCVIDVGNTMKDLYTVKMKEYHATQQAGVSGLVHNLQVYCDNQLQETINKISFQGSLTLPNDVVTNMENKKNELQGKVDIAFRSTVNYDYRLKWNTLTLQLQNTWNQKMTSEKKEIETLYNHYKNLYYKQIRDQYSNKTITSSLTTIQQFVGTNQRKDFSNDFKNAVKSSAYYHSSYDSIINSYDTILNVVDIVKDLHQVALNNFINKCRREQLPLLNEQLKTFVEGEMTSAIRDLEFPVPLEVPDMPYSTSRNITNKENELKRNADPCIRDDIEYDYKYRWETLANDKYAQWNRQVNGSKWKSRCSTGGNHSCPSSSCRQEHTSGVCHKSCSGSHLFWVDGPSKTAICDRCEKLIQFSYVVCATCETKLNCYLIDIPN